MRGGEKERKKERKRESKKERGDIKRETNS